MRLVIQLSAWNRPFLQRFQMKNKRPRITDLGDFLQQFQTQDEKASGVERLLRQHRLAEDQKPLALQVYREAGWTYAAAVLAKELAKAHYATPHYDLQGNLCSVTIIGKHPSLVALSQHLDQPVKMSIPHERPAISFPRPSFLNDAQQAEVDGRLASATTLYEQAGAYQQAAKTAVRSGQRSRAIYNHCRDMPRK